MSRASWKTGIILRQSLCRRISTPISIPHRILVAETTTAARSIAPRIRPFSCTAPTLKKRAQKPSGSSHKAQFAGSSADSDPTSAATGKKQYPEPNPEQPLDLADVTARWADLDLHFRDLLTKHTARGRFAPETLGRVPVKLNVPAPPEMVQAAAAAQAAAQAARRGDRGGSGKGPSAASVPMGQPMMITKEFPLGQLAQVVEGKGRQVVIIANEAGFVKPIMSAIQNNEDYNQQPQRGETELELVMKVELTLPEEAARMIGETVERWRVRVREARSRRDKTLKVWKSDKVITPDTVRKVEKALQMAQDRKMDEIKRFEDDLLRKIKTTQL